jgi:hypothetical protein
MQTPIKTKDIIILVNILKIIWIMKIGQLMRKILEINLLIRAKRMISLILNLPGFHI